TSSTAHNILLKDILDLRLEPPENEVLLKVVSIVKLALACLAANPKSRPAMQEVSRELSIGRAPISSELFDMLTLVCPSVCFIELNLINKPVGIQFRITSESDPEEPMGQFVCVVLYESSANRKIVQCGKTEHCNLRTTLVR
ncbi:hypothetical protein CFP56_037127, partial [Quercus suber]